MNSRVLGVCLGSRISFVGCEVNLYGYPKTNVKGICFKRCPILYTHLASYSSNLHTCKYSFSKNEAHNYAVMRCMTSTPQTKCWKCDKPLSSSTVFCESCNTLQSPNKNLDFFQIIGLKRSYNIQPLILKQKYRNLQTLLHPDKFGSKSKKEQELSEEFSSIVNKAYSTLLDPLERGLYLLSLHNLSIKEGTINMDKMFLMEIMERNEEIENETDSERLNQFYTINKEQLDDFISKVTEAFEANDIQLAKELLTKMKYYNSIDSKIKEIKQRLNIPD